MSGALQAAHVEDHVRSAAEMIRRASIEVEPEPGDRRPHERTAARSAQRDGRRPRALTNL
jgi:hypothetical protein